MHQKKNARPRCFWRLDLRNAIVQFSYLQLLDLLTTVAFLVIGVQEGNPLVRMAMATAPTPMVGLLLVKTGALLLGGYCWQRNKDRLLWRINTLFALLVAWNLVALIVAAAFPGTA